MPVPMEEQVLEKMEQAGQMVAQDQMGDMNPEDDMRRIEGIINSMTLDERSNPDRIDRSRRNRIASR